MKFMKISKLVILEQHFRLENLKMAWNQCYIAKTEFFLLSKNVITFSKTPKTPKNCLKVDYFCTIYIFAKVGNFEAIFRGEGVEIDKIRWQKEEILKFQNVKSDFLYLLPFSHKLTWKLANFRKLKFLKIIVVPYVSRC